MFVIDWLASLSLRHVRYFLVFFVPICSLLVVYPAWLSAQDSLFKQTLLSLKKASSLPFLELHDDPIVEKALSKYPVYLSLTTIPERVDYVYDVLSSMNLDHVTAIYLNIPVSAKRSSRPYVVPDRLRHFPRLHVCELESDFGPISKLLPTLLSLRQNTIDAMVIVIDDDVIYPISTVNAHIKALSYHPNHVSTTMPARFVVKDPNPPFRYQIDSDSITNWPNAHPFLIHGHGSFALMTSSIDTEWLLSQVKRHQQSIHHDCWYSDDVLISLALSRRATLPLLLADRYLGHGLLQPHPLSSRMSPLHLAFDQYLLSSYLPSYQHLSLTNRRIQSCVSSLF